MANDDNDSRDLEEGSIRSSVSSLKEMDSNLGALSNDNDTNINDNDGQMSALTANSATLRNRRQNQEGVSQKAPVGVPSSVTASTHRKHLLRIKQDCSKGERTFHRVHDPLEEDTISLGASHSGSGPEIWFEKHVSSVKEVCKNRTFGQWAESLIPIVAWIKTYRWKKNFITDLIAGLTVGFMIVPQSMSYAKLAGLPVEFGLYSSLTPLYAYAMFGSSRQLAVGPVALVSLLLNTGLTLVLDNADITRENTPDAEYDALYATMAIQTSFLVGICYILMGIFRLGFVTIFLSHAVVSGFTSAAAIIIGLSQIKYVFGYDIPSDKALHKMIRNIFASIDQFNWRTFVLGSTSIFFLLGLKKLAQKYPIKFKWARAAGPLVLTLVTIVLQWTADLESQGIPIVKEIPSGLPNFSGTIAVKTLGDSFGKLAVLVLSIVIVGFMESIAIAKQLSTKNNYEIDASKELLGLGTANLMAGLFNGYPLTGSFSRSAVNNDAGATSGISAIVTATLVGLTLLFLTPVFELLALPVLAAIVISGVVSLVDYDEAIYLWKVHKFDFGVWSMAFLGTLFLGVELGLGIAVGISLLLVIFESAYPHTAVLGRLPGTTEYRNIKNYSQAERYEGIVIARIDAPIYFANTHNIREKISKYEKSAVNEYIKNDAKRLNGASTKATGGGESGSVDGEIGADAKSTKAVKFIIIEFSAVAHIDTSGLHTIQDLTKNCSDNKIQLCITNPNRRVMERLVTSGVADDIGREHIFVSTHDAVDFCLNELDRDDTKGGSDKNIYQFFSQDVAGSTRIAISSEMATLVDNEIAGE
jgi:sulfate transporter 4